MSLSYLFLCFVDLFFTGPLCPISCFFPVSFVSRCCTLVFLFFISSHDRGEHAKGAGGGAVVQKMEHLDGCILLSLCSAHPLLSHPTAPTATGSWGAPRTRDQRPRDKIKGEKGCIITHTKHTLLTFSSSEPAGTHHS